MNSNVTGCRTSRAHLLQNEAYCVLPNHGDVSLQLLNLCICLCQLCLQLRILKSIGITCLQERR